jgi:hypothetical protein
MPTTAEKQAAMIAKAKAEGITAYCFEKEKKGTIIFVTFKEISVLRSWDELEKFIDEYARTKVDLKLWMKGCTDEE